MPLGPWRQYPDEQQRLDRRGPGDGTLAHYGGWQGPGHIGKPIKLMCDRVRAWLAEGKTVRIFTARIHNVDASGAKLVIAAIDDFCMTEFGRCLSITDAKDLDMIQLWDDRAIQLIPNTGEMADGK